MKPEKNDDGFGLLFNKYLCAEVLISQVGKAVKASIPRLLPGMRMNRVQYLPADFEVYHITIDTITKDDYEGIKQWPTTAKITLTFHERASEETLNLLEQLKATHTVEVHLLRYQLL